MVVCNARCAGIPQRTRTQWPVTNRSTIGLPPGDVLSCGVSLIVLAGNLRLILAAILAVIQTVIRSGNTPTPRTQSASRLKPSQRREFVAGAANDLVLIGLRM